MRAEATRPAWVDIRTPPPQGAPSGLITRYAGVAVEVGDLDRALAFYADLFGSPAIERSEGRAQLRLSHDQTLLLVQRDSPRIVPEGGIHRAFRVPADQLDAIETRLGAAGGTIERYHEDRESEHRHDRYIQDPDGNRIQLVAGSGSGIDHVVVETHDLEWAEVFYTQVLDARVEFRVGWAMADVARAWAWGEGKDDAAPWARRWETLYTAERSRVPRVTAQLFVEFAPGVIFGIYLAREHHPEPPRRQFRGTPWTGFWVPSGRLDELEKRLRRIRLRCMEADKGTGGPYVRDGNTLYVRDTGGNFLRFSERSA
jgi:catechol 2,3-dioxygenase-like lactoylglutathione lyase family enzyme